MLAGVTGHTLGLCRPRIIGLYGEASLRFAVKSGNCNGPLCGYGDNIDFPQRFERDVLNGLASDLGKLHNKLSRSERRGNQRPSPVYVTPGSISG